MHLLMRWISSPLVCEVNCTSMLTFYAQVVLSRTNHDDNFLRLLCTKAAKLGRKRKLCKRNSGPTAAQLCALRHIGSPCWSSIEYLWKKRHETNCMKFSKCKVQVIQWKFLLGELPRSGHQTDVLGESFWLLGMFWACLYGLISAMLVIESAVSKVSWKVDHLPALTLPGSMLCKAKCDCDVPSLRSWTDMTDACWQYA